MPGREFVQDEQTIGLSHWDGSRAAHLKRTFKWSKVNAVKGNRRRRGGPVSLSVWLKKSLYFVIHLSGTAAMSVENRPSLHPDSGTQATSTSESCFIQVPSISTTSTAISSGFLVPLSPSKWNSHWIFSSSFKQWYICQCLTISSLERRALIYSLCQLPWYKYSYHGWVQATNVASLDTQLGREAH